MCTKKTIGFIITINCRTCSEIFQAIKKYKKRNKINSKKYGIAIYTLWKQKASLWSTTRKTLIIVEQL